MADLPVLTSIDDARIDELVERDEFFWLDLVSPSDEELCALLERLGVHELAIEDTVKFGQRPKLDEFGSHALVVVFAGGSTEGLSRGREPEIDEVHVHVCGDWVITVRHAELAAIDALHHHFSRVDRGVEQRVVHRILDGVMDTWFPLLTAIDDEIDELETIVVRHPDEDALARVFQLKRAIVDMRKVIAPQRDLFARAIDRVAELPGLERGERDYFRDLYDHAIRIAESLDQYRDQLVSAMDVYLSTVANRQNDEMKRLNVIATIFLPLTFITGFFGQNFTWLVEHVSSLWAFLLYGIGGLLVPLVMLLRWLGRRGMLGSRLRG